MPRCGCATPDCNCAVEGGYGVQISGTGTLTNPYQVNADEGLMKLAVLTTPDIKLTLTGNGTSTNPYVLKADRTGTSVTTSAKIEVFDESGVWTKPAGKQFVMVTVLGGGGGGGSGAVRSPAQTFSVGGGGGAGGGYTEMTFLSSELPTTVAVTIGLGGQGGVTSSGSASGVSGTNGGASAFGSLLTAGGGRGGPWYGNSPPVGNTYEGGYGTERGGYAALPQYWDNAITAGTIGTDTYQAGSSGGAGGTPNSDDATLGMVPGGDGGDVLESNTQGGAGAPTGTVNGFGGNPPTIAGPAGSGGGGGAGVLANNGAATLTAASNGGNGAVGAGGGGGGGALQVSPLPGRGGNGGNGRIVVTSW